MPRLKMLYLEGNTIGEKGCKALAAALVEGAAPSLKVRGTHPSPHAPVPGPGTPPTAASPVTAPPLSRADPVRGQQAARAGGCVQGARDLPRALHRRSPVKHSAASMKPGLSLKGPRTRLPVGVALDVSCTLASIVATRIGAQSCVLSASASVLSRTDFFNPACSRGSRSPYCA